MTIDLKNYRYAVSVGRRQPMHVVHVDCIREIVDNWLTPIIVVGSTNGPESTLFNPINNPLNFAQQQEQIRLALPFVENPIILPLDDVGDLPRWCQSLVALLAPYPLSETIMHYRTKSGDKEQDKNAIKSLDASQKLLEGLGLACWKSQNRNPAHDAINAYELRTMPIDDADFSAQLAAPDFIKKLVLDARAANPDRKLLEKAELAPSLLDISLMRLYTELGVRSTEFTKQMDKI